MPTRQRWSAGWAGSISASPPRIRRHRHTPLRPPSRPTLPHRSSIRACRPPAPSLSAPHPLRRQTTIRMPPQPPSRRTTLPRDQHRTRTPLRRKASHRHRVPTCPARRGLPFHHLQRQCPTRRTPPRPPPVPTTASRRLGPRRPPIGTASLRRSSTVLPQLLPPLPATATAHRQTDTERTASSVDELYSRVVIVLREEAKAARVAASCSDCRRGKDNLRSREPCL